LSCELPAIIFAAGETARSLQLELIDDAVGEPPETIRLALTNPSANAWRWPTAEHTLTILNDDAIEEVQTAAKHWILYW
jgi:hypothetical protein